MKSRFIPVLLAALFTLSVAPAGAQSGTQVGSDKSSRFSYRPLTWDDFKVDDDAPGLAAQTQTFITFRYSSRARRNGFSFQANVTEVTFEGGFDKEKSWRRSRIQTDNIPLLVHEQGHLDINEIHLRRLKALLLSSFPQGTGTSARAALSDLSAKMKDLYESATRAMEAEQKRYDAETSNGTRRDIQREWTQRLKKDLEGGRFPTAR